MKQTKFAHIGMGTIIQTDRVVMIIPVGTTTANRYIEEAKKAKPSKYHNATLGHKFRSILVMDEGSVIVSCIKPMTLMKRMNDMDSVPDEIEDTEEPFEEEAETEDPEDNEEQDGQEVTE